MAKQQRPVAARSRSGRTPLVRLLRRRAGGTLMVVACVALPVAMPGLPGREWNWPLPGSFIYGALLSMCPGAVLIAVLAPLVSYRRRDALTMLLCPPGGIRMAWIIGTRLGQLPHRDWPTRAATIPIPGRPAGWLAIVMNHYTRWRQRRLGRASGSAETTS